MSIWKENYELMLQLRNFSIAYCTFVEAGGKQGDVVDALINKTIAVAVMIKENRDYIDETLNLPIPTVKEECEIASRILEGTYSEDRLSSAIMRMM